MSLCVRVDIYIHVHDVYIKYMYINIVCNF